MAELSVFVEQMESRCRIRLTGELDVNTAWRLKRDLETTWGVAEFDCAELTFVDSSGLGIWIDRLTRDGTLVLVNASPQVRRLLEICGLTERVELRVEVVEPTV
jgi:anti-anti-sigma factor